jgi:hypothetical protein
MMRALAFSVLATAPHAPTPPLTVQLQSAAGTQTCVAQGFAFDLSGLRVAGLVCPVDAIFQSNFEVK